MYLFDTSILFTSGSAIIGSSIKSKSITTSAEYLALSSGAKAGFSPDLISAIRLSAILINLWSILSLFSIPLLIITCILSLAISKDLISVSSSETQIEAFAFISAVQSVKVKD